jgi:hypothetical protein
MHVAGHWATGIVRVPQTLVKRDVEKAICLRGRAKSATTRIVLEATDAAHHARSSAAGSVRGEMHLVQTYAVLFLTAAIRFLAVTRLVTMVIKLAGTDAHHRA